MNKELLSENSMIKKKNRICIFAIIATILLVLTYRDIRNTSKYSYIYLGKGARDKTPELSDGTVITQEIPYTAGSRGISFQFSTNGHKVTGDVSILAVGESSGFVYIDRTISGSEFRNNEFVDFFFPKESPSEDERILVSFSSTSEPTNGLALMTTHDDPIRNHVLSVNGEEMDIDLMARRIISRKTYMVTQIINFGRLILRLAVAYVLLLSALWEKQDFLAFLGKLRKSASGIPGIVIFSGLITHYWGCFVDAGVYPAETAVVRFWIVFILFALLFRYGLINKLIEKVKTNHKSLLKGLILIMGIGMLSVLAVFVARRMGMLILFSRWKSAMLFFGVFFLIAAFYAYLKNKIAVDTMITLTILIMGSVYAVSYPITTGVTLDDHTHYNRTVHLFLFDKSEVSKADYLVIANAPNGGAPGMLNNKNFAEFTNELEQAYRSKTKVHLYNSIASLCFILSYFPAALGLVISRAFSLPFAFVFIIGRWMNALFYAILAYFTVKQLKSGKLIAFVIYMFPVTLFQISNYTYDGWVIGLPMLAFARFIGIMQDEDKKITMTDLAVICVLFILGISIKQVYCPLILSLLFVNKEKLERRIPPIAYYSAVILSCLWLAYTFVVPFLTANADGVYIGDVRGGSDVNGGSQFSFILSEPLAYARILLRSLKHYWSVRGLAGCMGSLGWIGYADYRIPVFLFVLIIVILDKSESDIYVTSMVRRIWTLLLAFGTSALIGTSMYLAYTPVRSESISGFQSRYILPILIFSGYYISDFRLIRFLRKYISDKLLFCVTEIVMASYAGYAIYLCCLSKY